MSGPLELNHLTLLLLVTTQFEVLASLDGQLLLRPAAGAFHPEDDFLCGFGLFPEDGLRLTTETWKRTNNNHNDTTTLCFQGELRKGKITISSIIDKTSGVE